MDAQPKSTSPRARAPQAVVYPLAQSPKTPSPPTMVRSPAAAAAAAGKLHRLHYLQRSSSCSEEPAGSPTVKCAPSPRKIFLKRAASAEEDSPRSGTTQKTVFDDSSAVLSSIALAIHRMVVASGPSLAWIDAIGASNMYFDERTYAPICSDVVEPPILPDVSSFLSHLQESGKFSVEVLVRGFHLFTLLAEAASKAMPESLIIGNAKQAGMGPSTWRLGILISVMLAQKVVEDVPYDNASFCTLWSNAVRFDRENKFKLGVEDVNRMENTALRLLQFKVSISPARFTEIFFDLSSALAKAKMTI